MGHVCPNILGEYGNRFTCSLVIFVRQGGIRGETYCISDSEKDYRFLQNWPIQTG